MKCKAIKPVLVSIYIAVFAAMFLAAFTYENTVTQSVMNTKLADRTCVVIDAGHGGIDGGATSYSGVLESKINLDIALRFNDLLHFLGVNTRMIRSGDYSVHTQGETIAQQKISDLKRRVELTNTTANAFLISIHQNYFYDGRYYGPQIFYANTPKSKAIADKMQQVLNESLVTGSKRKSKPANGIYLMERISCDGILVECGFLSNPEEDQKLQSARYQKQLCCVLASVTMDNLFSKQLS